MVDDYADAMMRFSPRRISEMIQRFTDLDYWRFRPVWELETSIAYRVFGLNSVLHHLFRHLLKFASGIFLLLGICRVMPHKKMPFTITGFVFAVFFLFFPNNPEARLAPQELILLFHFSLVFYLSMAIYTRFDGDMLKSKWRYFLLLFLFIVMILTKESSCSYSFPLIAFYLLIGVQHKKRKAVIPFIVVSLLHLGRIWLIESSGQNYGESGFDLQRFEKTANATIDAVTLRGWSDLFAFIFCLAVPMAGLFLCCKSVKKPQKIRQLLKNKQWILMIYFVLTVVFSFLVVVATSAFYVLRYTHVLLIPVTLLFTCGFIMITHHIWQKNNKTKIVFTSLTVLFCCWFIAANYHNYVYQFATQYYTRTNEEKMLAATDRVLDTGADLHVIGVGEPTRYIRSRRQDLLPMYGEPKVENMDENTISKWNPLARTILL